MTRLTLLSAAIAAVCALPATAQHTTAPGFQELDALAIPTLDPFLNPAFASLSSGEIVTFNGTTIDLHDAAGAPLATLGTLPAFGFPSFVIIDPTETFVVIGESSLGGLWRCDIVGGRLTHIIDVPLNFDADFDINSAWIYVSSSPGFGSGIVRIIRVNVNTGARQLVVELPGVSGPLEVDNAGDLFYASIPGFFVPAGAVNILHWTSAQLTTDPAEDDLTASVFSSGYDGGSSLERDPISGHFYLAESVFGLPTPIVEIDGSGSELGIVATTDYSGGQLEIHAGAKAGSLQPFQPANVRLRFNSTNYNQTEPFDILSSEIITVGPARPVATLSGPTSGPANKTLTITGALPNSSILVLFGNVSFHNPNEVTLPLPGIDFPFHSALPQQYVRRLNVPVVTDATGTAAFNYFDPGSLHGTQVMQALIRDTSNLTIGTSTFVLN
jgi:hypothetical protein